MFDDGGGGFDGFNGGGGGGGGAYAGGGAATGGDTGYGGYTAGGGGGGAYGGGGGGAYGGGGGGDYAFGGGGGGPSSSQNKNFGTPSSAKKDYDEPSISPLTVRQLLNAESEAADSHHMVDGKTLHKVKVVGCILSIQDASAFTAVQLDDSTGVILVKDWERDHLRTASLREGMYVRVIGTFQAPKGKPSLIASNMSAITDMDEITAHYLDAIYTHLYRTTSPDKHPAAQAAAAAGSGFAATSAYGAPAGGMGGGMGGTTFGAASSAGFAATSAGFNMGGDVDTSALPPLHKKVLDTIGANKNGDRGTSIDEVVAQVGAPPAQVRKAVDNLAQEGHLYSTVDENHWQVTCAT